MKPIRILHVLYAMNYAGTETLLMNLYRNIDREIIQFDFAVCGEGPGDYDEEIRSMGGQLIHYPRYKGINHLSYVKWWEHFFENQNRYYIVHGHIGSTAAIYLSIARRHGCYTIAHSHATDNSKQFLKSKLYKLYSYPTRRIANYYMGCSMAALTDRYGKKIATDHSKSRVFFNAIDAEKFSYDASTRVAVRNEFHIPQDMIVLGTVGRITLQKNPHMILDIISGLKQTGLKFIFLWFGRGDLETEINKKISELQLEDVIIMGGVRNDIFRVLQAMDIFVFPSLWEGLGITCVEAQAADLKCFCSSTIPDEARITKKYTSLDIDAPDLWVSNIRKYIECGLEERKDRCAEVRKAGYDIKQQAYWLESFYKGLINKEEAH